MKKFFKILGVVFGVILIGIIGIIGLLIYGNSKIKELRKKRKELSEKVESFESTNSDDYFEYSVEINKSGDFSRGFKYLDKAIELEPTLHLGYRGWIRLRKIRDFDNALTDFNQLDSLTPNFVDAPWGENINFLRGECYYGNKDYQKAIDCFNQSVKNQKEDWADIQTFVYLGICEYELENFEKSISEFNRALKQSINTCEAHFGLAKVYHKIGNLEKAKEHILKAEENIDYKREDIYNEFLNEIYLSEILELKQELNK
ncbi:MAG: tetratricopeptide repeat protein [Flavobacteriaceae bacterium]|nr:tetratricopeptide repeat protein [Flavobacteriaceae bacterium]